ncbi:class GN sortase [Shewanella psychropiezotolerans]|uniref:Class GN sortase n=1 Tax=Shewanella psychropiezotolerans TaxID=2593655 RepID=A0ABX5X1M6_9GAMM|nr:MULTISPECIES: class GN sortase [Shewanella]MPY24756.1 class GN sortase [Shewanella sp. YLB-07]QDO83848.1 class GN sortase [Shewanella psychropiezotolerans]
MSRLQGWRTGLCCTVILTGLLFLGGGSYMQAKAYFAQYLIEQAWRQTLEDKRPHKPWSWADTYPVAKLTLMTADNVDSEDRTFYVLSGASGRNLAFGPTMVQGGGLQTQGGNRIIAGHNDTHFSVLNGIKAGRVLKFQDADKQTSLYRVSSTQIVHESDTRALMPSYHDQLTLITCYPFNALQTGSPYRLIVRALPV